MDADHLVRNWAGSDQLSNGIRGQRLNRIVCIGYYKDLYSFVRRSSRYIREAPTSTMGKAILIVLVYFVVSGSVSCWTLPWGPFISVQTSLITTRLATETYPAEYASNRSIIYFEDGQMSSSQGDLLFAGAYQCISGAILVRHGIIRDLAGYMPILGLLRWEGQWYVNPIQLLLLIIVITVGGRVFTRYLKRFLDGGVHSGDGGPSA